ncbi:MAG: MAPEG family protein [Pseudomonadota bacterium]
MIITPLIAAACGLIYVVLSLRVIRIRFTERISLGHGDHKPLMKAVRTHANFAEYVPLTLLLLWFVETLTMSSNLVLVLGVIFIAARLCHVIGMENPKQYMILRQAGIVTTHGILIICSLYLIYWYLPIRF